MTPPRPMLAKVHIAKKELGLEDGDYRAVLSRVTPHNSAGDCSDRELQAVLDEFRRLGWKPRTAKPSGKPFVRLIYALWGEMGPLLGSGGSREALRTFVQRQTRTDEHPDGVDAPEFLDAEQASRVIEGLKVWKRRLERVAKRPC